MAYPLTESSAKNTIYFKLIRKNENLEIHPMMKPIIETRLRKSLEKQYKLKKGSFFIRIEKEKYLLNQNNLMYAVQRVMDKKDDCVQILFENVNTELPKKEEKLESVLV